MCILKEGKEQECVYFFLSLTKKGEKSWLYMTILVNTNYRYNPVTDPGFLEGVARAVLYEGCKVITSTSAVVSVVLACLYIPCLIVQYQQLYWFQTMLADITLHHIPLEQ